MSGQDSAEGVGAGGGGGGFDDMELTGVPRSVGGGGGPTVWPETAEQERDRCMLALVTKTTLEMIAAGDRGYVCVHKNVSGDLSDAYVATAEAMLALRDAMCLRLVGKPFPEKKADRDFRADLARVRANGLCLPCFAGRMAVQQHAMTMLAVNAAAHCARAGGA